MHADLSRTFQIQIVDTVNTTHPVLIDCCCTIADREQRKTGLMSTLSIQGSSSTDVVLLKSESKQKVDTCMQ